jgi:DNA repair exonuclease SbcCD ATPase subunit
MRLIVLEAMTITAFRCFSQETRIEFPTEGGFRFITGINKVEPALGSNGSGKSSLWDALTWCLYGTSIRGERASDLATWELKQRPHVIAQYNVDGETQIIDRTGSPDTLLLNNEPVPQAAVDALMGMTRLRFVHSVIFGQSAPLFMDLSIPERSALMDEIMGLGVWLKLSDFAGEQSAKMTKSLSELNNTKSHEAGRASGLDKLLQELTATQAEWQDYHARAEEGLKNDYVQADNALRAAEQRARGIAQALTARQQAEQDIDLQLRELQDIIEVIRTDHTQAAFRHKDILGDSDFLRDHKSCPTCKQRIDQVFAQRRMRELELQADDTGVKLDHLERDWRDAGRVMVEVEVEAKKAREARVRCEHEQTAARADVAACQRGLAQARQRLEEAQRGSQAAPLADRIASVRQQADQLAETVQSLQFAIETLAEDQIKVDYWKRGFRLVRLFLIRRILALLEIETASAAAQLGIGAWRIRYEIESGTRSPGIHVHAVNALGQGTYKSYSFGEAQRVKLAVSFGLASLIQNMAGVYHSVEVFDEPTAWLSPEGIDDLLTCLQDRTEQSARAVWLLDHRSMTFPFDEVWVCTREQEGTSINRLR